MKTSSEAEGMLRGRSTKRGVLIGARVFVCALLLCGLVLPAAAKTKSLNTSSAKISNLPAGAQSAVSAALGRDQQAYHATAVRKGYQMKNSRSGLQATFTRQGVRFESGKASWGMALAAFGTGGKLQPMAATSPQANENRVEYRRGALTEWYVNGPAGLEQGFTIAKAPAGGANGTLELALRLTGNMKASVDAAKTGLTLKGRQTSLRYSGLTARDAKGRKLRSWLEVRDGRLLVQVAAAGATYPLVVDPYIQSAKLVDSNGKANAQLGSSVAISGDGSTVVAVNLYGDAYVFTADSNWAQAAKLIPSQASTNGVASIAVSNDGSVVVVGSKYTGEDQGSVFVFVEPLTGGWSSESSPVSETAVLHASNGKSNDYLGFLVAVSGDGSTVVAGAPGATASFDSSGNPVYGPGAVYVFEKPGSGWGATSPQSQAAKLTASDGKSDDSLGCSVSISTDGSTVAAGADKTFAIPTWEQGAAYVFVRPGNAWADEQQAAKLYASDGAVGDFFGQSVAVSGDGSTVVAGAKYSPVELDQNGNPVAPGPGEAYVFDPDGGWTSASSPLTETGQLLDPDGSSTKEQMGYSVAVNGDGSKVAAGAPYALNDSGLQTGAVYIFTKPSDGWADVNQIETDKALATDGDYYDILGWSTGMSADGSKVVAGAPNAIITTGSVTNAEQGAAYVFTGSQPFSSFNASKLRITLGPPSSFEFSSIFVLGTDSDGINPLTDPVTLKIGSLSLTIPAGSFQLQNSKGNTDSSYYVFSGVVDGFTVNAKFGTTDMDDWTFKANGSSPNALSITDPVTVTLTIGNDSGTVTETVPIN